MGRGSCPQFRFRLQPVLQVAVVVMARFFPTMEGSGSNFLLFEVYFRVFERFHILYSASPLLFCPDPRMGTNPLKRGNDPRSCATTASVI